MKKEEILKNRILEVKSGSHLYGTSTPESDVDHIGIFVPTKEYYFGLQHIEQTNIGIIDKNEAGKNNPNIFELFFVDIDNIIYCNHFARLLLDSYELFLSKKVIKSFLGYAKGQKHKMVIRTEKWHELNNVCALLKDLPPKMYIFQVAEKYPALFHSYTEDSEDSNKGRQMIEIGDLSFIGVQEVKYVLVKVEKRLNDYSNRKDIIIKHGFDTKFASHLIRLLLEGKELVETGKIIFPLQYADLILDIKQNKYSLKEIVEMGDTYEEEFKKSADKTDLQEKPQVKKIEKLLLKITENHFNNKGVE